MAAAPRHLHRDTTSTSAIVAELDRVGYAIVEGMCSPDRVAAIKEELNRLAHIVLFASALPLPLSFWPTC